MKVSDPELKELLAAMVAGVVSPESASVALWSSADHYGERRPGWLCEFRELAINLHLHEEPDCEFRLEVVEWRSRMLELAQDALSREGARCAWGRQE